MSFYNSLRGKELKNLIYRNILQHVKNPHIHARLASSLDERFVIRTDENPLLKSKRNTSKVINRYQLE